MRCGQRQVYALAAPQRGALAQRVEREFVAGAFRRPRRRAFARGAQDFKEGVDEIGFLESRLLQVIPGVERLHDAAVDRRRHRRDHQHRRTATALVDGIDDGDAGMAFAAELDVEHDGGVVLARDRRLGIVAREPLVHGDARSGGEDPLLDLPADGRVVFDDGDFEHDGLRNG